MRYIISFAATSLVAALPAWAEVPRVVTDIHPVHSLVAQVMGDLGTPELLLERGANEHDFQLRPSQAAGLEAADLVVWIGPELTPWLARALDGVGSGAAQLSLLAAEGTETRAFSADGAHRHGAEDDAHEEHGHEDHGHDDQGHGGHEDAGQADAAHGEDTHDGHGAEEGHAHEGTDPHAWLDPHNAKVWLQAIAAELGRIDPDNATTYASNAAAAALRVDAVDAELAATLAAVKGRPLVVYHDAYGYFAAHYGLDIFGSVALGDATAPGAARLASLRDGMAVGGAVCLFPEAQHDDGLIQTLADTPGTRIGAALDPNGSLQEPGPAAWEGMMRALAAALAGCATAG